MKIQCALLWVSMLLMSVPAFCQPLPNNCWPNSTLSSGVNLGQTNGTPTGWVRNGADSAIDEMTNVDLADSSYALMVIDNGVTDPNSDGYGEWDCAIPLTGVANPGDTINVRYDLMYSVPENEMRVAVGFLDVNSNYLTADQFVVSGDSPGWNGGVDSMFTETNQQAVVPVGAVYLNIGVVSAGPLGTEGVLIVDDIYAARAPTPELLAGNFWTNSSFELGTNLDQTNGLPAGWTNYNSGNADITQVTTNNFVSATHALVVIDNDAKNYGSWYSDLFPLSGHAKPGDTLNLQWFQLYSITNGEMRVTISFYNAAGTSDIQDISYQVTGNSPAWRGAVEGSGFSQVNQQVTVPVGATQFLMQLVSGGNNSTTGIMMIDDLSIALSTTSPILADNFWPNPSFTNGVNLTKTTGTPTGWVRNGTDTTNDQVVTVNSAPTYALAVIDNETNKYGEWDGDLTLTPSNAVSGNLVNIQYSWLYNVTNGPMRLSVLFFDVNSNVLTQTDYNVTGQSTGWAGAIAGSSFTVQSNQVLVPANAARMRFALASGGPNAATGVLLIEHLSAAVQLAPTIPDTVLFGNFWPNPTFEQGADLDNAILGAPAGGWLRGGSSPLIDQLSTNNWTSSTHSLALVDNDPDNYGEWYVGAPLSLAGLATNGDALDIQWSQLYDITNGSMRLTLEFYSGSTNVQNIDFNTALNSTNGDGGGSSTNWLGTEDLPSTFDKQFVRLEVPTGADGLTFHFASGGSSAVTGIYLIDDLSVRVSAPNITSVTGVPGNLTLTWNSMATRTYTVLFNNTLSTNYSAWAPLATNIPGNFPTQTYVDTVNHGNSNAFYIIKAQ